MSIVKRSCRDRRRDEEHRDRDARDGLLTAHDDGDEDWQVISFEEMAK